MMIFVGVVYGLMIIALLLVRGARPERSTLSRFELERRAKLGRKGARQALRRENLLHDVFSLQHVLVAVILVTISSLGVLLFHWAAGFLVSLVIALESGAVARLKPIGKLSNLVYKKCEPRVLNYIEKFPRIFRMLRMVAPLSGDQYIVQSKEEFLEVVSQAETSAIDDQQKQLILHSLQFETRLVKDVMTSRSKINFISKEEVLGPLVLDELHKTGNSRFPVVEDGLDSIIGVLHVRSLLNLSQKESMTAKDAMEPRVSFIRQDQTLDQALAAFLRTRHHLFVVIDSDQKTVGILTLEDIIEALLGRQIRDEFDYDYDSKVVAERLV